MKVRVTKKVSDGIVDIPIHTEYIKLQDFLKFCNAVESGGMAKNFIVNEEVEVNGEVCTQRGKKPVSYTHLDVYKRQVLPYGPTESSAPTRR